jgi:hypothetical protein
MEAVARCRAPVLIIAGGDGLPDLDAPIHALASLRDRTVGGLGGRNIPINASASRVARAMALLWELHDRISQHKPKLGADMIAVRVASVRGARLGVHDDACLEATLAKRGLRIDYERQLSVRMRVPTGFWEAVGQRRRVAASYREIERDGHKVSTRQFGNVLRALLSILSCWRLLRHLPLLLLIESIARFIACIDGAVGVRHNHWAVAKTTRLEVPAELAMGLEPA